jgi:hypothetical protein
VLSDRSLLSVYHLGLSESLTLAECLQRIVSREICFSPSWYPCLIASQQMRCTCSGVRHSCSISSLASGEKISIFPCINP